MDAHVFKLSICPGLAKYCPVQSPYLSKFKNFEYVQEHFTPIQSSNNRICPNTIQLQVWLIRQINLDYRPNPGIDKFERLRKFS